MAALTKAMATARRAPAAEPIRQAIGRIALTADTPSEDAAIARLGLPADSVWPDRFLATAVNVRTGESIVWRAGMGISLDRAVASSCSLPGVWPPITINGERYMDGGIRSVLNADLASGHSAIIVVSCFPLALPEGVRDEDRELLNAELTADIDALRQEGSVVDLISPSRDFLALTEGGTRMLDASLAAGAFVLGVQQARDEGARLDPSWQVGLRIR
jgi:NTE family protein